jgi:hypothetical protein
MRPARLSYFFRRRGHDKSRCGSLVALREYRALSASTNAKPQNLLPSSYVYSTSRCFRRGIGTLTARAFRASSSPRRRVCRRASALPRRTSPNPAQLFRGKFFPDICRMARRSNACRLPFRLNSSRTPQWPLIAHLQIQISVLKKPLVGRARAVLPIMVTATGRKRTIVTNDASTAREVLGN